MEKKIVDSRKIVDAIAIFLVFAIFIGVVITNALSNRIYSKAYMYSESFGGSNVRLVDSADELKSLCNKYSKSVFNTNDPLYNSSFNEKIRGYGDKFFEKKSLIIYSFGVPDTSWRYSVEGVYREDDVLLLDIYKYSTGAGFQITSSRTVIVEVKKSDIKGVTEVQLANKD